MDLDENGNPIAPAEELDNDNLPEGGLPEGGADGADDGTPEPEELSLEDRLNSELEGLRSDEPGDDGATGDEPAATDGEPGDGEEPKPAEGEEGETTGAKPVEGEETPAEPDPNADPDDALAADMKERTRERFNEIRDENKKLKHDMDEFQSGSQELHNVIIESTATTQQLAGALQIFKSINSGDASEANKILPEIKLLYDAIAQTAGQPTLTGDVLEQFPDLQAAVTDLDITQEKAEELAGLRVQQNNNQLRLDQGKQQEHVQGQNQQASQQAASDIKGWEDNLIANDPDYKLLQPKLVTASKEIMQQVHPSNWLAAMQAKYNDMHEGLVLANKTQQSNSPQTLRPVNSGAKTKVDTSKLSMEELMQNSLANMRG